MDVDDQERALRRIRRLLDKAGSTSFGPEADALYDKAAELMARHRIDAALLEAITPPADRSPVVERPVDLGSGQYVRARLQLIHHVALHHGCRLLTHTTRDGRVATVVGIRDDGERVELLYTSLLLQAARMAGAAWAARNRGAAEEAAVPPDADTAGTQSRAGAPGPHRGPQWRSFSGRGQPRSRAGAPRAETRARPPQPSQVAWKREFMFGFAGRVGERLAELAALATSEAAAPAVGGSVALVLADRESRVDEWLARAYPRVRSLAPAAGFTGHGGLAAGRSSADGADLGSRAVAAGPRALRR